MFYQGRSVDCVMVREFSEEKRQEIFRLLDEIDNREWKSFMEWCGSSAEEFGDWPEKLNVSAYTRYVDEYHKKVLEINEMTRQQVNTVFENVAEINARYAARMRECREKIKEQVAMVRTMTEFMESMTDGNPNMALITKGSVNKSGGGLKVIDMNKKIDCHKIRDMLSLTNCELEDCMYSLGKLYNFGFVSEEDYRSICELAEEEKSNPNSVRNEIQEYFDHVVTTVYIYNCLQVLANRTFTPKECCEANEIFRYFGITDRNNISCFLICCAGESGGFTSIKEYYEENDNYSEDESGRGYLQITSEETQKACLEYIHDIYEKGELIENQGVYIEDLTYYPWTASAWYWAIYPKVDVDGGQPLNIYTMKRLGDNGEKLTLGVVLATESFVNGVVKPDNKDGIYTMNGALHVIARYDSLRRNDERNNGGWFIDGENKNCVLHIPADMLGIPDGTPTSNIQSVWNSSTCLEFRAPNNWDTYEVYYNNLRDAGLLDFDLNTNLP